LIFAVIGIQKLSGKKYKRCHWPKSLLGLPCVCDRFNTVRFFISADCLLNKQAFDQGAYEYISREISTLEFYTAPLIAQTKGIE